MFGILRYGLALLVAFGHTKYFLHGGWNWTGLYAVFGFFVLSGYLMTRVLHRTYGYSSSGFGAYLENRALRIYPAYWAVLVLSLVWLVLAPESTGTSTPMVHLPQSFGAYLRNFVLLGVHRDYKPQIVPPAWSLHIELCYYAMIGLGLSRTRRSTMIWLAAAASWTAWACYTGVGFGDRYSTVLAASLPFALGASLHYLPVRLPLPLTAAALVLFTANLSLAAIVWGDPKGFAAFYLSLALIAAVILGLRDVRPPSWLGTWDRRLGDLAYPIFLVHSQVGYLLGWLGWAQTGSATLFFVTLPVIHVLAIAIHLGVVAPTERIRARVRSRATAEADGRARSLSPALAASMAIAGSFLVAALIGEGLLRLQAAMAPVKPPPPVPKELVGLPKIEGLFNLAKPNQHVNYRGALYETNSKGIRGPEIEMPEPPSRFRIAAIGDSYTMGSGVRYEEAFPELMERALRTTPDGKEIEVINVGLSGSELNGAVEHRLPIALRAGADMIVYGWTVNDIEGPAYRKLIVPPQPSSSMLLNLASDRIGYLRDIFWPAPTSYVTELDENWFRNPAAWKFFERPLDKLAAIGRERGMCVIVFVLPQMTVFSQYHPYFRFYDLITREAQERGMYVVQGFPPFVGRTPEEYRCHPMDWHPNAAAHQLLADVLVDAMRKLPPQCWTARDGGATGT